MPVFYPPSQMRQMPLTPPEFYDEFAHYGKTARPYGGSQAYDEMASNPFITNAGQYYMPSAAEQHARFEAEYKRQARATYQAQMQREHIYGPIAAPVLPPLRVPHQSLNPNSGYHTTGQPAIQPPKEEKSAGGVAAHLDYDMDAMVDFVAEMTTGMFGFYINRAYLPDVSLVRVVQPHRNAVDAKFRTYVSSVLTSTRLPKATILLALHYLSDRLTLLSAQNQVHHHLSKAIYHLLTVGLMLSSKFLDDNTFQNRSWAEVSSLRVEELNARESDWLAGMCYRLHVDWEQINGVRAWFEQWDDFEARKKGVLNREATKLSPLDTSLRNFRISQYPLPGTFSPPEPVSSNATYSKPHSRQSMSPPSALPSAMNTPDFLPGVRHAVSHMELRQPYQFNGAAIPFAQPQTSLEYQLPPSGMPSEVGGDLIYTRESSTWGPGYVLETRSNGMCTWEVHNFVGVEYTQQYAQQLQMGWCDLHRRLSCAACLSRPQMPAMMMGLQAAVA